MTILTAVNAAGIRTRYVPNIKLEHYGRAVAQAVSRWIPAAAARVRVRASMLGLWWTKRHWGRFFRVLRFPLTITILLISPSS
jgi:hypothetical protein